MKVSKIIKAGVDGSTRHFRGTGSFYFKIENRRVTLNPTLLTTITTHKH